jgi:hypothetical protein
MSDLREALAELKPGRELDTLVAEKVMGIEVVYDAFGGPCVPGTDSVSDPRGDYGLGPITTGDSIPDYSTDISAAWEVVESMAAKTFEVTVEGGGPYGDRPDLQNGEGWYASFYLGDSNAPWKSGTINAQAWASTAPHALCLAALKAVGAIE